eukprot:evm.model.NODE_34660_length_14896_cov_19.277256.1
MDYVITSFKRKHKMDVSQDKRALARVRRECEKAKRALSVQTQTHIEVWGEGGKKGGLRARVHVRFDVLGRGRKCLKALVSLDPG